MPKKGEHWTEEAKEKARISHKRAVNAGEGGSRYPFRPFSEPTENERRLVRVLASTDLDDEQIAYAVRTGITATQLRQHFKKELEVRGDETTWARRIMRKKDRELVEKLSGYGLTNEQIAACACGGISVDSLRKYFSVQLRKGKADATVRNTMRLEQAAEEGSVPAMIHLDNTRGVGAELRKKESENIKAVVFDRVERVVIGQQAEVIDGEVINSNAEVGGSVPSASEV